MSPIGRIFIVLNLILSAVFLAWASNNVAQSHDFKTKYEAEADAHASSKADLEGQISALKVEKDTLGAEKETFKDQAADATAGRDRVDQENGRLTTALSESMAANEKNTSSLSSMQSTLSSIESTKDDAVAAQRTAEQERDTANDDAQAANTKSSGLEAQNAALNNEIANLKTDIVKLAKSNSALDTELATLVDVTGVSRKDIMSQEQINASVLQAMYDVKPGLVALNVGSKDGVLRGYTFEIYDGSAYKGQVRVENVREDMCTALILRMEDDQTIRSGDKAATRL